MILITALLFFIPAAVEAEADVIEIRKYGQDNRKPDLLVRLFLISFISLILYKYFGGYYWHYLLQGVAFFYLYFDTYLNIRRGLPFNYMGGTKKWDKFIEKYFPWHILMFFKFVFVFLIIDIVNVLKIYKVL